MSKIQFKLSAMLWDVPVNQRADIVEKLRSNPAATFRNDEPLFVKALNSFSWYELIKLIGWQKIPDLLTDSAINKLFPAKRRNYYYIARRLLSKYSLPTSGNHLDKQGSIPGMD
jgi:hypothetical protein